jgi:hypothetical protein
MADEFSWKSVSVISARVGFHLLSLRRSSQLDNTRCRERLNIRRCCLTRTDFATTEPMPHPRSSHADYSIVVGRWNRFPRRMAARPGPGGRGPSCRPTGTGRRDSGAGWVGCIRPEKGGSLPIGMEGRSELKDEVTSRSVSFRIAPGHEKFYSPGLCSRTRTAVANPGPGHRRERN